MSVEGRMGLPLHIDRVRVFGAPASAVGRLYAVVTPHPEEGSFDAEVVDAAGNRYVEMNGYRTIALPDTVDTEPLKAMHAAMA
jgi:hypothetical protein